MKKTIIQALLLFLSLAFSVNAQKIIVTETEENVDKTPRKGFASVLVLDGEKVTKAWEKQLKEWGKFDRSKDAIYVTEANLPTVSSTPVRIISRLQTTPKGVKIWYAIDLGDAYVTSGHGKYNEAEKLLHDFCMRMHFEDINEQIRDAERALVKSVRDQERMIQKGESIKLSIDRNKAENVRLMQKMEENKIELSSLKTDSIQNMLNQKLASEEVEKIKRAVEIVRTKLTKVE